jgi:hypothetical protein
LDQLKKHIKDTIEITEYANKKLIELLESLKEMATIWKIFAKTILKIRPLDLVMYIYPAKDQDLFCICR